MGWMAFLMFLCVIVVLMAGYPVAFTLAGTALAFAACQQGRRVRFFTVTGLVTQLLERRDAKPYDRPEPQREQPRIGRNHPDQLHDFRGRRAARKQPGQPRVGDVLQHQQAGAERDANGQVRDPAPRTQPQ